MIIIRPKGGLCNRIRAMDSAITLATVSDNKVHVLWEMNWLCNSKFTDLFEVPAEIYRITELNSGSEIDEINRRVPYIFSHYNNCCIDQDVINESLDLNDWVKIVSKFRNVYIFTNRRFFQQASRLTPSCFIPKAPLKKNIRTYNTKHMIGIHVRRSDNKEAIAYSPLEGFIKQMEHEVEVDDEVNFFLATDDLSVEDKLKKVFPGRISTHKKKSLDRNDPQAIHDAVIDLFSLAGCQKIIGSYWSTFSATAADIHGLEIVTIKENKFSLKPFVEGKFSLLVKLSAKIQVCENDSGELMVCPDGGEIIQLNDMSAAILNLCNQSMTVKRILDLFRNTYPEAPKSLEGEVIEALEKLFTLNIISVEMLN